MTAGNLVTQAVDLGLVTHQMGGFDAEKARSVRFFPIVERSRSDMTWKESLPQRQTTRAKWRNYRNVGLFFVTICTRERQHSFGEVKDGKMILNAVGQIIQEEWLNLREKFSYVDLGD